MDKTGGQSGEAAYRRFLEGDESAFEQLVGIYRGGLTRYINGFTNDTREAEELAVDAFAELAAKKNFKGKSSLKTYLFAIGRHLARRNARQYRADYITMDKIIGIMGLDENEPEAAYLRGEQTERLHAALGAIKPEYREGCR